LLKARVLRALQVWLTLSVRLTLQVWLTLSVRLTLQVWLTLKGRLTGRTGRPRRRWLTR
jgi:hypothetical protein